MSLKSGVQKVIKDHRNYSYHATFGAVVPATFAAEFNIDSGLIIRDQNKEGQPYGCTNYTTVDICTDEDKVIYNPIFQEKFTHANASSGGCIDTALKTSIDYGVQAMNETTDEEALTHKRAAYFQIEKFAGDWFDSIRTTIVNNNSGVSIATCWYREFEYIFSDGIIKVEPLSTPVSRHNWKICGWKTINGNPYLIGKTWQGESYGDKGFAYFPREIINNLLDANYSAAFVLSSVAEEEIIRIKVTLITKLLSLMRMYIKLAYGQITGSI